MSAKLYFFGNDFWDDILDADLLHDEMIVFLYLRQPPEPSLTALDEHRRRNIMRKCNLSSHDRLEQIISTLSIKTDHRGNPLVVYDNHLFFIPSATYEVSRSAARNLKSCIRRARARFERTESAHGTGEINRAFQAFLSHWKAEIAALDEEKLAKNGAESPSEPPPETVAPCDTLPQGDTPRDTLPQGATARNALPQGVTPRDTLQSEAYELTELPEQWSEPPKS